MKQENQAEQHDSATYENGGQETQASENEQEHASSEQEHASSPRDSVETGEGQDESAAEADGAAPSDAAGAEQESAEEVRALQLQIEELQGRLLRSQADFDNFRRRSRLEKEEFAKYASQKLIEQLLPVIDNFERALAASKESNNIEAFVKGVDMIFRQLHQVLEQEGLQPIAAVGEAFDPELHQAVARVETDEYEDGIIVEELQKGYKLKDKVIRPSMVKVSSS